MTATDALRRALDGSGAERVLTLDAAFSGLPDTAHGGSVLAAFDAVAGRSGPRELGGHYLKRVPLATPLRLRVEPAPDGPRLELFDDHTVLVSGGVTGVRAEGAIEPGAAPPADTSPVDDAMALPISAGCFACGLDNPLGLAAILRADDSAVGGTWTPRPGFRLADGTLAPVALTTLLDEAAFWLGALAGCVARCEPGRRTRATGTRPWPPGTPPAASWPAPPSRSWLCVGRRGGWSPACSPSTLPTCCVASSRATSGDARDVVSARRRVVSIWHQLRHDGVGSAR